MNNEVEQLLATFEAIDLKRAEKVSFLRRCDFKYIMSVDVILDILEEIKQHYYVMSVNGERIQYYLTTYFDTAENKFYLMHHSGMNNRFKVRKRIYKTSLDCYFEIKKKRLTGVTTKERIPATLGTNSIINEEEQCFIDKTIPLKLGGLHPTLDTNFGRITIISRQYNERVTIDMNLRFTNSESGVSYIDENFIVLEVKCDRITKNTIIRQALKKHGIRSRGFSKYCIGRAITNDELKQNRFKQTIKSFYKID